MSDNQKQKSVYCMNCGKENDPSDAFCMECGAKLSVDDKPATEAASDAAQSETVPVSPKLEDAPAPADTGEEAPASEAEPLDAATAQEQPQNVPDAPESEPQTAQAEPEPQEQLTQQQTQVIPSAAPSPAASEGLGEEDFGSEAGLMDTAVAREQPQNAPEVPYASPQATQAVPMLQEQLTQQGAQVIPPVSPRPAAPEQAPNKSNGSKAALIVSILALVVGLAVGAILIFKIPVGPFADKDAPMPAASATQKPKKKAQSDAQKPKKETQTETKSKEQDDKASKKPETGSYDEALAIWNKCGEIDGNIAELAKDFNASLDKGTVPAGRAQAIAQDTNDLRKELQELKGTDYGKQHKQTMDDLDRLVEDLSQRIAIINDACTAVSNGASKEQVMNILRRDVVDGDNKYWTDFKNNYEQLKPQE